MTDDQPAVIWSLHYTQLGRSAEHSASAAISSTGSAPIICLQPPSLDLAFDDSVIGEVKAIWKKVLGIEEAQGQDFLLFEDREGTDVDDEEYDT
jgi:Rab proteins geranylgeranyltransferase component A